MLPPLNLQLQWVHSGESFERLFVATNTVCS